MNVYVRELVSALAQAGVDCDVFTRRWRHDLPVEVSVEPGVRVVHVPAGPADDVPKESLPDLVDEFTDGVVDWLRRPGHDVDAVHANYWLSGVAGHRVKHELGLPLVSTFHTLARVKVDADVLESAERVRAEIDVIGCSDVILANCEEEADDLRRHYDAPPERIEIVAPGVDHAFFSPGDRDGARAAVGIGDHPVLLFVGRIQPLKGLDVAVAALAQLADSRAELVVVGGPSGADGPGELARVLELASALGVRDRIKLVPPQPHHLLSTWYRAADVVVVPSRAESFGLVALEAAACGRPVVAAEVGGLRTLVDDGRTGFLVDGRDPGLYAERIDLLLGDPGLASALGRAGAARAQQYRWSTAAARLRRIYTDVAARAPVECR